MTDTSEECAPSELQEQVDAVLLAARVLVALSARSLAAVEDVVTLTQLRVLVALASHGKLSVSRLVDTVELDPTAAERAADRLATLGLVHRRGRLVGLTEQGDALVRSVTRRRRAAAEEILHRIPKRNRPDLVVALRRFAAAGGARALPDF